MVKAFRGSRLLEALCSLAGRCSEKESPGAGVLAVTRDLSTARFLGGGGGVGTPFLGDAA